MSDDDWLSSPAMKSIVDDLVRATIKQYRIDAEKAEEILSSSLATNKRLRELAENENVVERIARTSVFKKAAATAKREVYFALRRYRQDESELASLIERLSNLPTTSSDAELTPLLHAICQSHASTRERQSHAAEFYEQLFEHLRDATSILDVGCGMQPLQFPFPQAPKSLQRYVAFDTDTVSISAVQALAAHLRTTKLLAFEHDLGSGWDHCCTQGGADRFDVALMLKLVPVVHRRARASLAALAQVPAKKWVISGSKQSMTKRRDITRREESVIRSFLESAHRNVTAEFTVGEEFVFVVE